MAKKKKAKSKAEKEPAESLDSLPQNIVSIGERVEEDKNIYISQSVYKEIHKFTKDKTVNEAGGLLIGNVIEEFGKQNIIIRAFIPGKRCQSTPTTITFTHETWQEWHKEKDKKYPDLKIIGWIHTHPNYGIFLSENDKFIQKETFNHDFQVAYVVDPIQHLEGFFFWINGKIEKCNGFYVYDKIGKKIDVEDTSAQESEETAVQTVQPKKQKTILAALCAAILILAVLLTSTALKVKKLEDELAQLTATYNQNMGYLVNVLNSLNGALAPKGDSEQEDDNKKPDNNENKEKDDKK